MVSGVARLSAAAWLEDLAFLIDTLLSRHPNPFTRITREEFLRAADELRAGTAALPPHAIVIGLKRLLAIVRDGHTNLPLSPIQSFRHYPVKLYLYSDGLYVQAAAQEITQAAGARVLSIGGHAAEDAYELMRRLVSYDNEMMVKQVAPALLTSPEVLQATGLVPDMEKVRWTLLGTSGEQLTLTLSPRARNEELPWVDARDLAESPAPLYLTNIDDTFWFGYLDDSHTVYVQLNGIQDKEDEKIAHFYDRMFDYVADAPVERLVIDLRLNHGGNNHLNQSLIHHLICCGKVNRPGRLFTIIGRTTFSAAMNLTNDLERHTYTLFVGEPTGSSPNHFGDAAEFTLPNSRIAFYVSTLFWQYSEPYDHRPWVAPDLPAALSSADYRANRDPALDVICSIPPGTLTVAPFPERVTEAIKAYGHYSAASGV